MKHVIYIDMDDTLCDFMRRHQQYQKKGITFPQGESGFWLGLSPLPDAIESVNMLRKRNDVDIYILTAPSVRNPHSYMEKRQWIEAHFGYGFCHRLIFSADKSLLKGHILIDDYACGKGQERFEGKLIQFGSPSFPTWQAIMQFLDHHLKAGRSLGRD